MLKNTVDDKEMIKYMNGDVYIGRLDFFKQPHGRGIYEHHPRLDQIQPGRYNGDWKHGDKNGGGIQEYTNGDRYEGSWIDDKRHGSKGVYTYYRKDPRIHVSEKYDGPWQGNNKHGIGTMVFTNGDKYVGRWVNGVMQTLAGETATYTFKDGSRYQGKHSFYFGCHITIENCVS